MKHSSANSSNKCVRKFTNNPVVSLTYVTTINKDARTVGEIK